MAGGDWSIFLWFLGLALGWYQAMNGVAARWADALARRGRWEPAVRVARLLRPLSAGRRERLLRFTSWGGRSDEALARAELMVGRQPPPATHNEAACAFITEGRYGRALELALPVPEHEALAPAWRLLEVNLAEAQYNLGDWTGALERVERLAQVPGPRDQLETAGCAEQRAWILAHQGEAARARAALAEVTQPEDLGPFFQAEHHFTDAAVCQAEGRLPAALEAVERGLAVALRVSSRRNGLYLRARLRAASGDTAGALADFEAAASMDYRGQGGDGLLAWGDLLRSLGREDEARAAWRLAVERDPESESARLAAGRTTGRGEASA